MDLKPLICYENDELIVLNKPAGLLVHPVAADSVALTQFLPQFDLALRPAHRLDRDTSGALICGRGTAALKKLGNWFMQGRIRKLYRARVSGLMIEDSGLIDAPLLKRNARMVVDDAGANAQTKWRVLTRREHETLLELEPLTGRTHQLRAHLRHLGHPILGDLYYNGPASSRLWLHAYQLEIPDNPVIQALPLATEIEFLL